jgi:hypothetical protein
VAEKKYCEIKVEKRRINFVIGGVESWICFGKIGRDRPRGIREFKN